MKSLFCKRLGLLTGLLVAGLGLGMTAQTGNAAPHGGGFSGGGSRGGSFHGGGSRAGSYQGGGSRAGSYQGGGSRGGSYQGSVSHGGSYHGGGYHGGSYHGGGYHGGSYHGYAYRPYYRGYGYSFGFGFGYSPSYYYPSYDESYPAYYPAVVQQPAVVGEPMSEPQADMPEQPQTEATQEPAPPQQAPAFVQTHVRFHEHGDNAGRVDWVEGLLNGRPVRIYYDDFGRVSKQKWLD